MAAIEQQANMQQYSKNSSHLKAQPNTTTTPKQTITSEQEQTAWKTLSKNVKSVDGLTDEVIKAIVGAVKQLPMLHKEVLASQGSTRVERFNKWAQDHKKQMTAAVISHPYRTVGIVAGVIGAAAAAVLFGRYVGYGTVARMLPDCVQKGINKIIPSFDTLSSVNEVIAKKWKTAGWLYQWTHDKAVFSKEVAAKFLARS